MKRKLYNAIVFFFFAANVFAQKTDKKYSEKFYTSNNVEIEINASNADVEVQNWNKNEVSVEASIEVEGVPKEEAQKYIDKWNFEALGNKSKVKINANANKFITLGQDFISYNTNSPNTRVFSLDENANADMLILRGNANYHYHDASDGIGTIFLPNMEEFHFPEVQSEILFSDIDELVFDFDKYAEEGDIYFFEWKDDAKNIKIKSKKEWEKFKKSKEYKKLKKELKEHKDGLLKAKKRSAQRKALQGRRKEFLKLKKIGRQERKQKLEERKQLISLLRYGEIKNAKKRKRDDNLQSLVIERFSLKGDGKKVKIKKKVIIKAPKKAVINLNTRHCKIKLPNSRVSGRASYGTFKADGLVGGNLNIYSSPVDINILKSCTLLLNNVQDAEINTISNLQLNSNSSIIRINDVKENAEIKDQFGNLEIRNIDVNFNKFHLDLNSSTANIKFIDLKKRLNANFKKSGFRFPSSKPNLIYKDDGILATGNFKIATDDNSVNIKGKYSKVNVEK